MSLITRLLTANPSIQVSTLLSGSLSTPSAKRAFSDGAFDSIASYNLTDRSGSFVINNIPQNYKHLQFRVSGRTTGTYTYSSFYLRPNSDTGSNYTFYALYGDTSTPASSGRGTGGGDTSVITQNIAGDTSAPWIYGFVISEILDYSNTNKYKTFRSYGGYDNVNVGSPKGTCNTNSNLWLSTSAITSIQVSTDGDFQPGTIISLYGIKA